MGNLFYKPPEERENPSKRFRAARAVFVDSELVLMTTDFYVLIDKLKVEFDSIRRKLTVASSLTPVRFQHLLVEIPPDLKDDNLLKLAKAAVAAQEALISEFFEFMVEAADLLGLSKLEFNPIECSKLRSSRG